LAPIYLKKYLYKSISALRVFCILIKNIGQRYILETSGLAGVACSGATMGSYADAPPLINRNYSLELNLTNPKFNKSKTHISIDDLIALLHWHLVALYAWTIIWIVSLPACTSASLVYVYMSKWARSTGRPMAQHGLARSVVHQHVPT
jgi:hypothetical protein